MGDADWMPGIGHDPGANAGYNGGRSRMESMVLHYTAGAYGGDYSVGLDGYFNFYCPRDEPAVQFAEGDALTWHAGEWNDQGPGIELERRDDSWSYTDHQLDDLGRIARWLHDRYGIPLDRFYDTGGDNGARQPEGATAGMCVTHRSLAQSGGWHSDYLTREEWERALGGGGPAPDPIDWTRVISEREEGERMGLKFAEARLEDGRVVTAIRGTDGGVYYRILGRDGDYVTGHGWAQVPGVCRFQPDVMATLDGGCRLKVVGSDWGAYEAVLAPGGDKFSGLDGMGPGTVAGLGDYA